MTIQSNTMQEKPALGYTLPPMGRLHVLSMGAGVNTAAMLLKYPERYTGPNRYVIFADTGDEHPDTYKYLDKYLKPFCKDHNMQWIDVKGFQADSLYEYEWERKTFPLKFIRECTKVFKIRPINKFIRNKGARIHDVCTMDIGFCIDESHRWNPSRDNEPKYRLRCYPFFQDKITRADCENIIKDYGWPIPPKSGCYYCPFASKDYMKRLSYEHPKLFEKAAKLEANDRKFPNKLNWGKPLPMLVQSNSLDEFMDDSTCDEGHCMT